MKDISQRKADHLELAESGDVGFKQTTTLFECVRLIHDALPELALEEVDTSVNVLGKRLAAPLVIAAMTGGHDRAERVNRELAALAEQHHIAFGLGSQRAMHKSREKVRSYAIRDVAPTALVFGNLGIVQASSMSSSEVEDLILAIGADALCVHLNPAMELIQDEGDRDFRGGIETLARLTADLHVPLIAKETGCGISSHVARRLREAGVRHVDVPGAGGTSWVAVETHRASGERRSLGYTFWDWGIPTAASVYLVQNFGFETVIATGGVKSGLDIAKAITLGATLGGVARPVLQALERGGRDGAAAMLTQIAEEVRIAMLLVGARNVVELGRAPRIVTGELVDWMRQKF
jgi:isopentenyl-diphosphate delta-isomerase